MNSRLSVVPKAALMSLSIIVLSIVINSSQMSAAWVGSFLGLGFCFSRVFVSVDSSQFPQGSSKFVLRDALVFAAICLCTCFCLRTLDVASLTLAPLCSTSAFTVIKYPNTFHRVIVAVVILLLVSACLRICTCQQNERSCWSVGVGFVVLHVLLCLCNLTDFPIAKLSTSSSVAAICLLAVAGFFQNDTDAVAIGHESRYIPLSVFLCGALGGLGVSLFSQKNVVRKELTCAVFVVGFSTVFVSCCSLLGYQIVGNFGTNFPTVAYAVCALILIWHKRVSPAHHENLFSVIVPTKGSGFLSSSESSDSIFSNTREGKLRVFLLLTFLIMLLEFFYGLHVNSLGLVSDSFHMLLDAVSICVGLLAASISDVAANEKTHPFGYKRYEVLAGFINGVLLLFIALFVMTESLERILDPPEIEGSYLLPVAVIGLLINIVGVVFFHDSHGHSHSHSHPENEHDSGHSHCHEGHVDHNMRGVYLHILADMLGSVSVIVSSVLIHLFGWWIADPICSAISATFILASAFPLLEGTGSILLLSAPKADFDVEESLTKSINTAVSVDVSFVKIWVHSTPPRDLLFCAVSAKMQPASGSYAAVYNSIVQLSKAHISEVLNISTVNAVVHLEQDIQFSATGHPR